KAGAVSAKAPSVGEAAQSTGAVQGATPSPPLNVNVTNDSTTWHSEVAVAIDPSNASNVISASNRTNAQGQYRSADGGQSWSTVSLPLVSPDIDHTDPAVAWTSSGTAWTAVVGENGSSSLIRVYKSTNKGASWQNAGAVSTGIDNDKDNLWIDTAPSSPFRDQIYVVWDEVGK